MPSYWNRLNQREKHTFLLTLSASAFNGLILGILILQEVILKKTLNGTALEITLLTMVPTFSNIFSVYFSRMIKYSSRKSQLFLIIGIFGRLLLIASPLINSAISFIFILFLHYLFNAFLNPLTNNIMQVNFRKNIRGRIFAISDSVSRISSLVIALAAGVILDYNDTYFRILFVFAGLFGFICCLLYSRIKIRKTLFADNSLLPVRRFDILYPFKNMINIFSKNKPFGIFELFFFIYGMGFLIVLPAMPIYFVDIMHMDYSQISFAKGVIGQVFMIFALPLMGIISDKSNPILFSSASFFLLAFYPILLALAPVTEHAMFFIYLAFLIFSIAISGVIIVWNLASIFFAGRENSADYQAIHVTLTGIRGIIAPLLGYLIMKSIGVNYVFFAASGFLILASVLMAWLYVSNRRTPSSLHRTESL